MSRVDGKANGFKIIWVYKTKIEFENIANTKLTFLHPSHNLWTCYSVIHFVYNFCKFLSELVIIEDVVTREICRLAPLPPALPRLGDLEQSAPPTGLDLAAGQLHCSLARATAEAALHSLIHWQKRKLLLWLFWGVLVSIFSKFGGIF